jgi:hypothetical protein
MTPEVYAAKAAHLWVLQALDEQIADYETLAYAYPTREAVVGAPVACTYSDLLTAFRDLRDRVAHDLA